MTRDVAGGAGPSHAYEGGMRVGSVAFDLRADRYGDAQIIAEMFKQPLTPAGPLDPAGLLEITEANDPAPANVPHDGVIVSRDPGVLTLVSEVLTASWSGDATRWQARIRIYQRPAPLAFRMHLQIALHRILLELGAVHLHAGAVTLHGRTFVFVGEKGAGKSSIAVMLGRAGATILSDDHVLIRAAAPAYLVSGCEAFGRVTADTEAAAFDRPLAIAAADYAGTLKKEFTVGSYFSSRPHTDAPIAAVLFPRVGASLAITRRSARAAAIDLIQRTRGSFRPQGVDDVQALLDFWSGLAAAAPAYSLELSPDVGHLARLPALLDACARHS